MNGLPPWSWVVASISCVQLAAALAVPILDAMGASTVAWLRLAWAGLLLVVFVRPWPEFRAILRGRDRSSLALGVATAAMTLGYFEAIARLPLGMANAIEFMGPLGVAAATSHRLRDLLWVVLAAAGVALVLRPGEGWVAEPVGVGFAVAAAFGWGAYILLTKRVGAKHAGMEGLALGISVAAVVATPVALAEGWGRFSAVDVLAAGGIAVLSPLLPYALEMAALRRLRATVFGVLMSIEPAVATVLGLLILGQHPDLLQGVGIACVTAASIGIVAWG